MNHLCMQLFFQQSVMPLTPSQYPPVLMQALTPCYEPPVAPWLDTALILLKLPCPVPKLPPMAVSSQQRPPHFTLCVPTCCQYPCSNILITLGSDNPEWVITTCLWTCFPQTSLADYPTLGQSHPCPHLNVDALFLPPGLIGPLPLPTSFTPTFQRYPLCPNNVPIASTSHLCRWLLYTFPCSGFYWNVKE